MQLNPPATAAARIADTILQAAGGRTILLRLPGPAAANDDSEQLGLATPQFNDIQLGPAAFRHNNSTATLLLSATAVQQVIASQSFESATTLFATATGLVIDDTLYTILSTTAAQTAAQPFYYTLKLQPPTP